MSDQGLGKASAQERRPQPGTSGSATPSDPVLEAAKRVIAAYDEVNAWMALGWPARTLVAEPNRNTAKIAFDALRAAIAKATSPSASIGGE